MYMLYNTYTQGCINCGILVSGMRARGVSSEHMENMEMFSCSPIRCALILRELNQIFIACLFKGGQEQSHFLQALLFTAFLVTVLKMLTYALVSTWSLVSSGYEHIPQLMQPCVRDDRESERFAETCEYFRVSSDVVTKREENQGGKEEEQILARIKVLPGRKISNVRCLGDVSQWCLKRRMMSLALPLSWLDFM